MGTTEGVGRKIPRKTKISSSSSLVMIAAFTHNARHSRLWRTPVISHQHNKRRKSHNFFHSNLVLCVRRSSYKLYCKCVYEIRTFDSKVDVESTVSLYVVCELRVRVAFLYFGLRLFFAHTLVEKIPLINGYPLRKLTKWANYTSTHIAFERESQRSQTIRKVKEKKWLSPLTCLVRKIHIIALDSLF